MATSESDRVNKMFGEQSFFVWLERDRICFEGKRQHVSKIKNRCLLNEYFDIKGVLWQVWSKIWTSRRDMRYAVGMLVIDVVFSNMYLLLIKSYLIQKQKVII